jgi:hypothetical protein
MTCLETKLAGALLANAKLWEQVEGLLGAYAEAASDRDRASIIRRLMVLFDSSKLGRARRLANEALSEAQRATER